MLKIHETFFARIIILFLSFTLLIPQSVLALPSPGTFSPVTTDFIYDGNGNRISQIDGNGQTTLYSYDAVNRLTSIDYADGDSPDVQFSYDSNGNITSIKDSTGRTLYSYDLYDRLIAIDYPDGNFVKYGYDINHNLIDLQYGNTLELNIHGIYTYIRYSYDTENRRTAVENVFKNETTTYTYNAIGQPVSRTLPNGVATTYGYDESDRFNFIEHRKPDNSLISSYTYTLNSLGFRTSVVENTPEGSFTSQFTYDAMDQLDTVIYPDGRTVDYDYDSFGNRTRMTEVAGGNSVTNDYIYDTDNRLLSISVDGTPDEYFFYDAIGNLTQRIRESDSRQIDYVYDQENRLIRYFDGTNNVTYVYNGVGERVAKIVNGTRTQFINDPNRPYIQVLAETNAQGETLRTYEWGNEILRQADAGSTDEGFYLHDSPGGSVRTIVDDTADTLNHYAYDAFGIPSSKQETIQNYFQYNSEFQEKETGLVFLRARYVEPEIGRFLTRDPVKGNLSTPSSLNSYLFTKNNPINFSDPSGLIGEQKYWQARRQDYEHDKHLKELRFAYDELKGQQLGYTMSLLKNDNKMLADNFSHIGTLWSIMKLAQLPPGNDRNRSVATFIIGQIVSSYTPFGPFYVLFLAMNGTPPTYPPGYSEAKTSNPKERWQPQNRAEEILQVDLSPGLWTIDGQSSLQILLQEPIRWMRYGQKNILPKHYWNINEINRTLKPGGVALNKSAEVLLDLNEITGGTYDEATGQVIIFGKEDSSPTALPPMDIDDLSVAFQAVSKGSMPVVSIEDPVVSSPPEWPGRDAFTVRYGPFQNNPETGEREVLDLSSKTHFGWVMFEADRLMKSLGLGIDNRTGETVSSDVLGYYNLLDLTFRTSSPDNVTTRFWFHPKDIVIAPSSDGNSMEFQNVEVQLSTETMFASNGQVQSTLDAEYFVQHFTEHYDEIAAEQISYDDEGNPHYIFKELKQLAALVGVVQWIKDSNIPIDLSSVESHTPLFYDSAPGYTPQTTVSDTRSTGFSTRTVTIKGGVNYCTDLYVGSGGSSGGIADTAQNTRPAETEFSWSFTEDGQAYNAAALSLEKKEKSGGFSQTVTDVSLQVNGTTPLTLSRFYDSFDVEPTLFGWGWHGQPYFIELRGERSQFNLCAQEWDGYSKIWFHDRAGQAVFDFSASGIYNRESDPLGLSSRFVEEEDILVYRYRDKDTPGLIFSDNTSKMVVRFSDSTLVEFSLDGNLHLIEDRNGNKIEYSYDSMKQLTAIEQPGGRAIALMYNSANQVTDASLPDGHSVHYTYDSSDNLISAQYDAPFGRLVRYVYDSEHRLSEIQDENSESTASWQYDVYGRVTETVQPGGTTPFQTNYNLTAGTTTQIGPNATSQNTVNNEDGDPTKITDSLGNETIMNYNSNRDLITVLSADNKTLQYYYDERGNTIATVYPNGRADMVLFDSDSNPAAKFHSFFNSNFFNSFSIEHILTDTVFDMHTAGFTDYDYDLNGNLISVTDALDNEKTFGYDVRGNMIWAKDSNNNQHNFTYDDYGRMITQRNPLNHYTTYTYDDTDNVTQVETPAGAANFTYNEKNELESVTKGDPGNRQTTSYLYNTKGQLIQVTNPVGIITEYQYDDRGNLTQVMHDNIARFAYQYNELNQLTETSYSGTSGGGEASIIITTPVGSEELHNNINISWQVSGNWGEGNRDITIQYSTDGTAWHDIATVNIDDGIYAWNTGTLSSNDVWIRFLRPGDNNFSIPTTPPFIVSNGTEYYVNDDTTNGDQYSTAAGQPYNGTTVTGRSPVDPVNQIQDIIEYNDLEPGDTIYVDAGNYSITSEIVFTEDDSGSEDKPILLTGPTNGEHAVIQQINPLPSCLRIQDMSPEVGHAGGGIIIQNLELSGAETGVLLLDAQYCLIQNNDIHDNGINYSSGLENKGIGIQIAGGGFNTIESNRSYNNGAIGPSGANPGENGGAGRGFGIMVFSSNFNLVRNNECYNNGGTGGTPGSDNDMAGFSEGVGILVENGTGNHILHNTSYNNDVNGVSSENARGGNGQSFGIVLLETTDSTIERNIVYNNDAVGGNSTGSSGGWGWSVGIYGQGENNLTVLSNSSFFNTAKGGYSGTASTDYLGDGDASGILLQNCPGSLVKNNLSHNNSSFAWDVIGNEYYGIAYAYGIGLISSSDCELYNNTCYRNWAKINGYASDTILTGQIYAGFSSTGTRIKNNTMALSNPFSNGIFVSTSSQTDLISDNNNIHKVGTTNKIGVWGATTCETMLDWQQVSGQDVNSYSVDPLFYDAEENNFHLSSQSPLIDQGISLTDVQSDGDGETRPIDGPDEDSIASYDIGYDEFVDSDSDGLANIIELELTGTDPYTADTDQDGLPDGWEVENGLSPLDETSDNGADGDPDNDGYTNSMEFRNGSSPNNDGSLPQVGPQITSALPVSLNQFIQEEDSILFSVTASDNNGDEISYSWLLDGTEQATTSSWAFATTDISSGSTSLSKEYVVQLIIEAGGDHVTREWAVMVVNRNHTPVLELINNIAVLAGDTVSISPVFSDQDNQNLVDGDNNIVSIQYSGWMTDPVRVTGSGDIGNHLVTVTVTDDGSPALNTYQVVEVNVLGSRIDFYKLDDDLDGSDLAEFGQAYISGNNAADINDDNTVDSDDINNFAEHFGR